MFELPCASNFTDRFLRLTLAFFVIAATPGAAQETTTPDQADASAGSATAGTGLLDGLSKLFKSPAEMLSTRPDTAPKSDAVQQAPPVPNTVAPAAVEPPAPASTRLLPGMASGREVCPRSANGAPDCQAGADKLCQSKGYRSGKGLNTDSAFSCSTRQARAEGRKPCGTEHFVTSAFCQ